MNSNAGGVHHFDRNFSPGIYEPKRQNAATATIVMYISLDYLFISDWFNFTMP